MKNKNLSMIVRASFKARKLSSALFCFFVILSFVLVYLAVGIVVPLGENIETKINRHIMKREIDVSISYTSSDENVQWRLEKIRGIPNVVEVYEDPTLISVYEESGLLHDSYILEYVHKYFNPRILSGRAFEENEENVALVPAYFEDYNSAEGRIVKVEGAELVGKTLQLSDYTGAVHSLQVVGTYDSTDPMFKGDNFILIPRLQLMEFNELTQEYDRANTPEEYYRKPDHAYIAVIDSHQNTQAALNEMKNFATCSEQYMGIDEESYNMAFIILLLVTVFFALLTVFGFYMFLRSNINMRTKELALYRAIGYRSGHLFHIVLVEHLLLVLGSVVVGIGAFLLLTRFAVDPYLGEMFGSTFMSMSVDTNPLVAVVVVAGYVVVTLAVCAAAVRRSERIDLTILLME